MSECHPRREERAEGERGATTSRREHERGCPATGARPRRPPDATRPDGDRHEPPAPVGDPAEQDVVPGLERRGARGRRRRSRPPRSRARDSRSGASTRASRRAARAGATNQTRASMRRSRRAANERGAGLRRLGDAEPASSRPTRRAPSDATPTAPKAQPVPTTEASAAEHRPEERPADRGGERVSRSAAAPVGGAAATSHASARSTRTRSRRPGRSGRGRAARPPARGRTRRCRRRPASPIDAPSVSRRAAGDDRRSESRRPDARPGTPPRARRRRSCRAEAPPRSAGEAASARRRRAVDEDDRAREEQQLAHGDSRPSSRHFRPYAAHSR